MGGFAIGALVSSRQPIKKAVIEDGKVTGWITIGYGDVGRVAQVNRGNARAGKPASYVVIFGGKPFEMLASHLYPVDGEKEDEIKQAVLKVADPDLSFSDSEEDDTGEDGY